MQMKLIPILSSFAAVVSSALINSGHKNEKDLIRGLIREGSLTGNHIKFLNLTDCERAIWLDVIAEPSCPFQPLNRTEDAEKMLFWFFTQIQLFIYESHFDTFRFDVMEARLTQDLAEIVSMTSWIVKSNQVIKQQLTFVRFVFDICRRSVNGLLYYNDVALPEHYLLNRIFDLNVRILSLFNVHGVLDISISGYFSKILQFQELLAEWVLQFRELQGLPQEKVELFAVEVLRAEVMLWELVRHIPPDVYAKGES